MDKSLELSAGRSRVRIPGRDKCSLGTTAVNARVKYPLYLAHPRISVAQTPPTPEATTDNVGSAIARTKPRTEQPREQL